MTAPTQPVTFNLADFGGPAVEGVRVTARLSDFDYTADGIFVSNKMVTGTTDASGSVVLDLFPNALSPDGLGTRGTRVLVLASPPGSKPIKVEAVIPDEPCNLVDVLVEDADIDLTEAQLILARIGAAAATAKRWYPGAYAADPTTRPDGTPMQVGDTYATTGGVIKVYDGVVWVAVNINMADLASNSDATKGAALVGYDGLTVQDVMDSARPMASYTPLRAYTGRATSIRITQTGISGFFWRDDSDTTSADNGGTIIVDASGRRWKRIYDGALNIRWFGATADGATNDAPAIVATIAAAAAAGGGKVFVPIGTYRTTAVISVPANVTLEGEHRYKSFINFFPTAVTQAGVQCDGVSNAGVKNLRVRQNGARAINKVNTSLTFAGGFPILLKNATECEVIDCDAEWGSFGIFLWNTTDDSATDNWTTNSHNIVRGNRVRESGTMGIEVRHAINCTIEGNNAQGCGSNGFKLANRNYALTVRGNIGYNNGGDGFDFYDGLIASTVTGNVADDNDFAGYELKGTFGGGIGANDYVWRDNTFSANAASRNGTAGYNVVSIRNTSFAGNVAHRNATAGFVYTSVQACTMVGETATQNSQHGFEFVSSPGNTLLGCNSKDNSYSDGTAQNGTYNGFNLDANTNLIMIGCSAANETTAGIRGGMGYGINLAAGGSNVIGGSFAGITGTINGLAGNFRTGLVSGTAYTGVYQDSASGSSVVGPSQINVPTTLTLNGTAPTVAGGNHFLTNSTIARRYTDFSGANGQRIVIFAADVNTSVGHNATIRLRDGVDLPAGAWTWVELVRQGGVWYETAHFPQVQSTPSAKTTSATLTAAELLSKIITVNQGAGGTSTLTLPTAANLDTALVGAGTDYSFEFSVINTSTVAAEDATIAVNTGWTLVGEMTIESNDADRAGSSGRFRARKTAAGAWTLYRLA